MAAEAGGDPAVPAPGFEASDWASVTIDTPLSPDALRRFLADAERLYRINPLYEIDRFERLGPARWRLVATNLANARALDVELDIAATADGIVARYRTGLKAATAFRVAPYERAARLVVEESYAGSEAERRGRVAEVDTSLNAWGRALHDYLRHWARWSWLAPWRWYMARVWQPMRPSARRIVYMIWVISIVEMIALVVLGGLIIAMGGLAVG
jgi:hypothetical protein